ncbi:4-alpha-glucanotransferase [Desulfovibrio litoralis]|uniref:4-alpha-glucanotransferase n=1 Tax=Desulfovibrio litoralis DSM 11393 TaxID=1121455 RepID=A0A1M7RUZ4_9BACT|nr:4-alpha-glucanotransferase [Desulfovibrio litoralis]SHN49822.1 4-alpha-glucanotransferase [Desulfovibrio litoralis DSM 11393]
MNNRSSGVLLHISSLPSKYGIGDLGTVAYEFAKLLINANQLYWQMLPITPTNSALGNSPYSSPSAFAGNYLFISPEMLVQDNFISWQELENIFQSNQENNSQNIHINYELVEKQKKQLLDFAYQKNKLQLSNNQDFQIFCKKEAYWLNDYAAFCALKEYHQGLEWKLWAEPLKHKEQAVVDSWSSEHCELFDKERFIQFIFYQQWNAFYNHCKKIGLKLIGDLPIYVTYDSADVWANPQYFKLDDNLEPTHVAGVPPDYFSETGQRWGNPVYNWNTLKHDNFSWWVKRVKHNLNLFDTIRIDHFRGFVNYWEIEASEQTAINGEWIDAPGFELFETLNTKPEKLSIIAEDLGIITSSVKDLRDTFEFPGMKVLQFAFGGNLSENPHIPFSYTKNSVVYTGTHDNPTTKEWFSSIANEEEKQQLQAYVGHEVQMHNANAVLMRLAMASIANIAIIPMQDILALGEEGRMNTPSSSSGNWSWRMTETQLNSETFSVLSWLTKFFAR